jgi:hypothetical protein
MVEADGDMDYELETPATTAATTPAAVPETTPATTLAVPPAAPLATALASTPAAPPAMPLATTPAATRVTTRQQVAWAASIQGQAAAAKKAAAGDVPPGTSAAMLRAKATADRHIKMDVDDTDDWSGFIKVGMFVRDESAKTLDEAERNFQAAIVSDANKTVRLLHAGRYMPQWSRAESTRRFFHPAGARPAAGRHVLRREADHFTSVREFYSRAMSEEVALEAQDIDVKHSVVRSFRMYLDDGRVLHFTDDVPHPVVNSRDPRLRAAHQAPTVAASGGPHAAMTVETSAVDDATDAAAKLTAPPTVPLKLAAAIKTDIKAPSACEAVLASGNESPVTPTASGIVAASPYAAPPWLVGQLESMMNGIDDKKVKRTATLPRRGLDTTFAFADRRDQGAGRASENGGGEYRTAVAVAFCTLMR